MSKCVAIRNLVCLSETVFEVIVRDVHKRNGLPKEPILYSFRLSYGLIGASPILSTTLDRPFR